MNKLVMIALISVVLLACDSQQEKIKQQNIDLVKNYIEAVERMDFGAMEEYLADDYLGMGPSYGDSIRKTEAVENWKSNVENLYESIQYTRSRFAAVTIPEGDNQGDWVANWAELAITYKGGGKVIIWANSDYLIRNGKIARSFTFYNEADALRQLGYKIVPPSGTE